TRLFALGNLTLELGDEHEISYVTLFNQSGGDYVFIDRGVIENIDPMEESMRGRILFEERSFWFNQLRAKHFLGDASVSWRLNATRASRDEPDTRDFRYSPSDTNDWNPNPWGSDAGWVWAPTNPADGQRLWSSANQRDFGGGIDLEYDWKQAGIFKLQLGSAFYLSELEFDIRRFQYRITSRRGPAELFERPPEELFAAENYGSGGAWTLAEITGGQDGYDAREDLYAAYASVQVRPTDWLRLFAGVRVEGFRQQLTPGSPFSDSELSQEELQETRVFRTDIDALPVGSLVATLMDDMFLRASYSVTVARPRARELSGLVLPNFTQNRTEFGDPNVQRTRIQNLDVRWEWFPSATEVVSLTGFAKLFEDPIELVILDANRTITYQNIERATNYGLEAEVRFDLGRFTDALENVTFGSNLTLVLSQAELTEQQQMTATSNERPLSFQSPWVANVSLGYDGDTFGAYLFYNAFGPRIEEVGANGIPDTYRQTFHRLDLQLRWQANEHAGLKLSVKNVLNQRQRLRAGDLNVRAWDPGVQVSLGFGLDY
ncbi:MAG TPA: TonB-dependent receptor, partial [Polyangiaceae bacterium LLY-WYZ-15_(1-7)]|nr:TonB-dependent receptor [Polyangiaceae bacterium LLY-WYZ-15_(1-7)]